MPDLRPHTKRYSADARQRLGLAVTRAREAAGWPYRPAFSKETGLSVRSIVKLEQGDPVGPAVYEAVARALPGWTEDTPRIVLDGGPIPTKSEAPAAPEADDEGWTEEDEELMQHVRELAARLGIERVTAALVNALREEWETTQRDRGEEAR